jgi:hypothetical protein
MMITFVLSCLLAGVTYIVLTYFLPVSAAAIGTVVITIIFTIVLSYSFRLSNTSKL